MQGNAEEYHRLVGFKLHGNAYVLASMLPSMHAITTELYRLCFLCLPWLSCPSSQVSVCMYACMYVCIYIYVWVMLYPPLQFVISHSKSHIHHFISHAYGQASSPFHHITIAFPHTVRPVPHFTSSPFLSPIWSGQFPISPLVWPSPKTVSPFHQLVWP